MFKPQKSISIATNSKPLAKPSNTSQASVSPIIKPIQNTITKQLLTSTETVITNKSKPNITNSKPETSNGSSKILPWFNGTIIPPFSPFDYLQQQKNLHQTLVYKPEVVDYDSEDMAMESPSSIESEGEVREDKRNDECVIQILQKKLQEHQFV